MEQPVRSPVTGGAAKLCDTFRCADIVDRYRNDWGLEVATHFEGRRELPLYRCEDTGYRFFHPPTLAGEAAFYDQFWALENPRIHRPAGTWRDDWQFALDRLRPGERVLDVGCADGAFLERAREIAEAEGIDENAAGCRVAQRAGLKVTCTAVGDFAADHPGAFDVGRTPEPKTQIISAAPIADAIYIVHDTTIDEAFEAAGVAAPIQQATLSTRLMGAVTDVLVQEGDRVAAGQPLVRIDARDLTAKSAQAAASVAGAEAMQQDAMAQANRIRGLYADSAATRAQLDAAETGLARARAGLEAARAAASELGAISSYSIVKAPFAGIVTKRFADPGAFATPGAPLVAMQDVSTLRISASTTPTIARGLHRGQTLTGMVERTPVRVTIEGVVPATAGNLYTINALVPNPGALLLAGSRATLTLPTGQRRVLVVPSSGLVREGDLTGVTLRTAQGDDRRWVRLGRAADDMVEVTAGLRPGDRIVVSTARVAALAAGN